MREENIPNRSSLVPREYSKADGDMSDKAHGIIMGLTMVLIFPLGAMSNLLLRRVLSSRSLFGVHVGCQITGLTLLITGLELGAWAAASHEEVRSAPNRKESAIKPD